MRFLLLRIGAIRQPRRWALPHEAIGRELGGVRLATAYSQEDWFAIASLAIQTARENGPFANP